MTSAVFIHHFIHRTLISDNGNRVKFYTTSIFTAVLSVVFWFPGEHMFQLQSTKAAAT